MRTLRAKLPVTTYYHIVVRVAGKEFLLHPDFRNEMRKILGKIAVFCGVEILTYCIMSNHVHLVVRISGRCEADEKELIRRYKALHNDAKGEELKQKWKNLERSGRGNQARREQRQMRRRMEDISAFMKLLNQLWTVSYNKAHKRKGTLWESRFYSQIVDPVHLPTVCAYVDLNPVRAKTASAPGHYKWCGFGEALGLLAPAARDGLDFRKALTSIYQMDDTQFNRQMLLSEHPKKYFWPEGEGQDVPREVWEKREDLIHGFLPIASYLRCRVGYFTRGFVIGSKEFVNEIFKKFRRCFGRKRKTGARKVRGCKDLDGILYVARDLRKDVVCLPRNP